MKKITIIAIIFIPMRLLSQSVYVFSNISSIGTEIKEGTSWYDRKGNKVKEGDTAAYYYQNLVINGDHNRVKVGFNKTELINAGFIKIENEYFYEGTVKMFYEDGQKQMEGEFKNGVPIKLLQEWEQNGKLELVNPVNGKMKIFKDGELTSEGTVVNGLGNGEFILYSNGKVKAKYYYKNGLVDGLLRRYDEYNDLEAEEYLSPLYKRKNSIEDGLQLVNTNGLFGYIDRTGTLVIPCQYKMASSFQGGVARVINKNDTFFIDVKNNRLSDMEAEKIRKNWKADVKVFSSRQEIVKYLNREITGSLANSYRQITGSLNTPYTSPPKIALTEDAYKREGVLSFTEFKFSDVIGIKLRWGKNTDDYEVVVFGKMKTDEKDYLNNTKEVFVLDESLSFKAAYKIRENLKHLAILNGGNLMMEQTDKMSLEESFNFVDKIVKMAVGQKKENGNTITSASFTKNKCETVFSNDSKDSNTGMEWDKVQSIYYSKEKGTSLTRIVIFIADRPFANTKQMVELYVPDDQVLKVIAAIYRIEELNKE